MYKLLNMFAPGLVGGVLGRVLWEAHQPITALLVMVLFVGWGVARIKDKDDPL